MNYEFLEEAREELVAAALYYESKVLGLGTRFRREVEAFVRHIATDPFLWRERPGGYRRVNCPVFSHYVAYIVKADTIVIVAVAHGHRRPGYWKDRTGGD